MPKDLILFSPPVLFVILLAAVIVSANLLSRLSFRRKVQNSEIGKPYACGEESPASLGQPDYGQFFPFAFFFTILHVITLIVTTVPAETAQSFAIAVIYILGAVAALCILFRR